MDNKYAVPVAIIVAGVVIAGAVFYTSRSGGPAPGTADQNGDDSGEIAIREVSEDDHIRGNPNAQLVIVEYSDFECPFCKNFHATMAQVIDEYGKDGQVAWVYRHFPLAQLHSKAPIEAEATECAAELGGNEGFWAYSDMIFDITPSNNGLDLDLLPEIAEDVGLDREAFEECLESGRHKEAVQDDFDDARGAGGTGTPYSVIVARTGQRVPINGAQPIENIRAVIDALLGESE